MNKSKIFKSIAVAGLGILAVGVIIRLKKAIEGQCVECCCCNDDGDGNPCHMTCAGMADEADFDDEAMAGE